ncbi:MAG: helix-hairpin-helix domain-containing protein [Candidatus Bathyarchaeia archaeon]|nr:helix-hairpin-helix domain-containing protein [Candidatus Bathyarchaeia archaeon]
MRSDYALYTVAIIFFIITGVVLAYQVEYMWTVATVVLGLLFIGLGYSQRPKSMVTTIETPLAPTAPTTLTEEKSETAMEIAPTAVELTEVKGIGEKRAEQLKTLGINSAEDLAKASAKDLAVKLKVSPKITERWIKNAKEIVEKP